MSINNTLHFIWNHDWKNNFSFETIHITNIWKLFFTNPNTTCVNPANSLSYIDNTSTMFFTISFSPPLKSQFTLAWLQHFGLPLQTSFKSSVQIFSVQFLKPEIKMGLSGFGRLAHLTNSKIFSCDNILRLGVWEGTRLSQKSNF